MAQSVRCLPHKQEFLGVIPSAHTKARCGGVCLSTQCLRDRQKAYQGLGRDAQVRAELYRHSEGWSSSWMVRFVLFFSIINWFSFKVYDSVLNITGKGVALCALISSLLGNQCMHIVFVWEISIHSQVRISSTRLRTLIFPGYASKRLHCLNTVKSPNGDTQDYR